MMPFSPIMANRLWIVALGQRFADAGIIYAQARDNNSIRFSTFPFVSPVMPLTTKEILANDVN
jgi:hypothetical protein